jgi:chromosome segregation ATPase
VATLKEFAQSEVTRFTEARQKTMEDLAKAQEDLKQAQKAHEMATRGLQELNKQIAEVRRALADAGQMPPDLQSLVDKLGDLIKQRRAKRPDQLKAERKLDLARAQVEAAQAQFQAATEGLRAAQSACKTVDEENQRRHAWKQAARAEPLVKVPDDARAVLNTALHNEAWEGAQKWLSDNLPEKIRVRAAARRSLVLALLDLQEQSARQTEALLAERRQQGLEAEVARLRATFNQMQAALVAYVDNAKQRLAQALDLLEQVKGAPSFTPEVKGRITDAELLPKAEAAAEKEKARDDVDFQVRQKKAQLEKKEIEIQADDVDVNPSDNANVKKLQGDLAALEKDLQNQEVELGKVHADLEVVEAAIPDRAWETLVAFETAQSLLQDLAQTDPNALVTALDDAEAKLSAGLEKQDKARRSLDRLAQSAGQASRDFEQFRRTRDRRVLSAVCGDL